MSRTLWIVATVLWLLAIIPSSFLSMSSFFMFDAPGSDSSPLTWALFSTVLTLPVFWLVGAIVPWFFYKKRWGAWLFLFPFLDVAAIVLLFVCLSVFCNGNFTCKPG